MLNHLIAKFTQKNQQINPVPKLNQYFYQIDRRQLSLRQEQRLFELEILINSVWQRYWLGNPGLETPIYESFCGWRSELEKEFGIKLPS